MHYGHSRFIYEFFTSDRVHIYIICKHNIYIYIYIYITCIYIAEKYIQLYIIYGIQEPLGRRIKIVLLK